MSLGGALLTALIATGAPDAGAVVLARDAQVTGATITLGDLADLSRLPPALRARAKALPIAEMPQGRASMRLAEPFVVARAGALMPALAPWLGVSDGGLINVRLLREGPVAMASAPCMTLRTAVARGAVATADALTPGRCDTALIARGFHYDAPTGAALAVRDLKPGEAVTPMAWGVIADAAPGERVYVTTSVGPVRVTRAVETLQPALAGRAVFVRADDGAIFSAPSPERRP
jgi:hypothetical protein